MFSECSECEHPSTSTPLELFFCPLFFQQKRGNYMINHIIIQRLKKRLWCKFHSPFRYYLELIVRIICIIAFFCSTVRLTHAAKSSLISGVISIISPSAKNCDTVIPNPLQIASNVLIEGRVFLLKIFASVDSDKPHSFDKRYSVQPRSFNN